MSEYEEILDEINNNLSRIVLQLKYLVTLKEHETGVTIKED